MTVPAPKKNAHLCGNGKPFIVAKIHPHHSQSAEKWVEQNRAGMTEYNQWILKNGVFSDDVRRF